MKVKGLYSQPKDLGEKKQQSKQKECTRKRIIEIKTEINEVENKNKKILSKSKFQF